MVCADFRDYGSRLLTTNDNDGISDTQRLLNYIDSSNIIKEYINKCIKNSKSELDIEKVRNNMEFRDKYPLPISRDDEVAFTYSLLKYGISEFGSYCAFAMHGYSSESNLIQDYIDNFNDQVVRHFINNIVKYLENLSITAKDAEETATEDNLKIFISYCWADKDVVDLIDKDFQELYGITFTRDERDLKFKQSIRSFMQGLSEHDYVIMVISDSYIKSDNCLYEVMEVMRDRRYRDKIYCVILNENDKKYYSEEAIKNLNRKENTVECNIYNPVGRVNYNKYWNYKKKELSQLIKELDDELSRIEPLMDLRRIDDIVKNIGEFLNTVSDMKNESVEELKKTNYKEFLNSMKIDLSNLDK